MLEHREQKSRVGAVCRLASVALALLSGWWLAMFAGGGNGDCCFAQSAPAPNVEIVFARDVQPILERRCVACHGPRQQKGGLRLDTREFAEQGGESGNSLLEPNIETNELLNRVNSEELGHRMPLEGPRLADNEIALLRQWVASGASWPRDYLAEQVTSENNGEHIEPWWSEQTENAEAFAQRFGYTFHILLVLLVASLVLRRIRKRWMPNWLLIVTTPGAQSLLLLAVTLGGAICYAVNLHGELADARQAVAALQGIEQAPATSRAALTALEPYVPRRPGNSISPTYYRGNDERSPALFNGGFYRTATFRLALCDDQRRPLAIGDPVGEGPLLIRLEIERSPHATETLFMPEIMNNVLLSPVQPVRTVPGLETLIQRLDTVRAMELWAGYYPVDFTSGPGGTSVSGNFFVCRGTVTDNMVKGELHYEVAYYLELFEGKLTAASNLTMGSLYHTGNLQVAQPGMIQHNEWFDSRPIPIITGPNSSDTKLLGVEEHLGSR